MKLEEKQEHFEYRSPADLYVHKEPFSPEPWNERLLKIGGRCPAGDPRLRIVWGGTEKKRGYAQTPTGSVPVMTIKYPGPIPKARKLKSYCYFTGPNQKAHVARIDLVPEGKMAIPEYEYLELGMLRWIFERKFTPSELVAAGLRPDPRTEQGKNYGYRGGRRYIAPMEPKGEYVGLYPLTTPDGLYWEPVEAWFESLAKTQRELDTLTPGERQKLLNEYMDRLDAEDAQRKAEEQEEQDTLIEDVIIEAEKAPKGRIIFS